MPVSLREQTQQFLSTLAKVHPELSPDENRITELVGTAEALQNGTLSHEQAFKALNDFSEIIAQRAAFRYDLEAAATTLAGNYDKTYITGYTMPALIQASHIPLIDQDRLQLNELPVLVEKKNTKLIDLASLVFDSIYMNTVELESQKHDGNFPSSSALRYDNKIPYDQIKDVFPPFSEETKLSNLQHALDLTFRLADGKVSADDATILTTKFQGIYDTVMSQIKELDAVTDWNPSYEKPSKTLPILVEEINTALKEQGLNVFIVRDNTPGDSRGVSGGSEGISDEHAYNNVKELKDFSKGQEHPKVPEASDSWVAKSGPNLGKPGRRFP